MPRRPRIDMVGHYHVVNRGVEKRKVFVDGEDYEALNENDLVSVVIPCYNQAEYLEEAVESVIRQTYANIEIIIVNDGSPDNTEEVSLALQQKYPLAINVVSQANSGPAAARNNGISQAHGEYILCLDADDILHPEMIRLCLDAMLENDADIVYIDLQCFGTSDVLAKKKAFSENHILYENLPPQSSLYKKEVWRKTHGYKQNMKENYEDWEFWINAYKHNFKFYYLEETLMHYRVKEVSRDTLGVPHDKLLRAKIVMNHPELYTEYQVENAIETLKTTEKSADLYFSYSKEITIDEQQLMEIINDYLKKNVLQEQQIINAFNKKIGLCSLDRSSNAEDVEEFFKKTGIDLILFYAPIRYEVQGLRNIDIAWLKEIGLVKADGTLFPFMDKTKREDPELQRIAKLRFMEYQNRSSHHNNQGQKNLISIVIPCYNQAQYLQETVESVIAQTYTNIEIIIVNDGSTDSTSETALGLSHQYADKNIRIVSQENKGLSEARNSGVSAALGDFIFILDSDDKLHKTMLSKCMRAIEEHDVDIVYGDYQRFGEENTVQRTGDKVELYFLQHANVTGATALYKRSVWEKTGGYKQSMAGGYEDWEFWVNATKNGFKFYHIPEVLFYYRVKKESMYIAAAQKHTYLHSKIVMNHPELYTDGQQDDAIKSIKAFENTPDLYFYFDKNVFLNDKEVVSLLGKYIEDNKLYSAIQLKETSTFSLEKYGTVALCSFRSIKNNYSLEEMTAQLNVNHVVLYSELKHNTEDMNIGAIESSSFAWNKSEGSVIANGTIFPAFLDNSPILKIEAYKRSEQYLQEKCRVVEQNVRNRKYLSEKNIDSIRDGAVVIESMDIKLAYELMSIAHQARPGGPFIKKKLDEYKSLLDANDDNSRKT